MVEWIEIQLDLNPWSGTYWRWTSRSCRLRVRSQRRRGQQRSRPARRRTRPAGRSAHSGRTPNPFGENVAESKDRLLTVSFDQATQRVLRSDSDGPVGRYFRYRLPEAHPGSPGGPRRGHRTGNRPGRPSPKSTSKRRRNKRNCTNCRTSDTGVTVGRRPNRIPIYGVNSNWRKQFGSPPSWLQEPTARPPRSGNWSGAANSPRLQSRLYRTDTFRKRWSRRVDSRGRPSSEDEGNRDIQDIL